MPFERFKSVFITHFRDQNNRIISLHLIAGKTERFPNQSFDAVSLHAFAVFFSHGNTHRHFFIRRIKHGERGGKRALSLLEKPIEIRLFFEPIIIHYSP